MGQLLNTVNVAELLIGPSAESSKIVLRIEVGQDTSAACVNPVSRVFRRVACLHALRDGLCRTLMVGSICSVYMGLSASPPCGLYQRDSYGSRCLPSPLLSRGLHRRPSLPQRSSRQGKPSRQTWLFHQFGRGKQSPSRSAPGRWRIMHRRQCSR